MEELIILNINNGIRAIRMGTKTIKEANLGIQFTKLKPLNEGLYQDLLIKYKSVVEDSKNRK